MRLLRPWTLALVGASLGSAALLVATTSHPHRTTMRPEDRVARPGFAGHAHLLSCKPVPPVAVSLAPGATAGMWNVRLEALEATASVSVSLGSRRAGMELARVESWSGDLAAGEVRVLEIRFDAAPEASEIWAEARVRAPAGSILRSEAAIGAIPGRASDHSAADGAGRMVHGARGELVVEYTGVQRGGR